MMLDRIPPAHDDLARTTISVLGIAALIAGTLWVLRPFVPALLWATVIVVSTWPVMLAVQARLGGRRGAAVAVMTLVLLLVLFVPLGLAIATVLAQSDRIGELLHSLSTENIPPPPSWLETLPFGDAFARGWQRIAGLDRQQLADHLRPYLATGLSWLTAKVGGLGGAALQLVLSALVSAILYARGEGAARGVRRFFVRLSGERGDAIVTLSGQAIRAVALGIVVTAMLQTVVVVVGLLAFQVPLAGLIAAVAFILCLAQLGPLLAVLPCVAWLYLANAPGRATALLGLTLVAQAADNVIRPLLIRRGANLPLLLIIPGVIGGLMWLGLIGLFIGPIVLAVTFTLLEGWITSGVRASMPDPAAATKRSRGDDVADERGPSLNGPPYPGKISRKPT